MNDFITCLENEYVGIVNTHKSVSAVDSIVTRSYSGTRNPGRSGLSIRTISRLYRMDTAQQ